MVPADPSKPPNRRTRRGLAAISAGQERALGKVLAAREAAVSKAALLAARLSRQGRVKGEAAFAPLAAPVSLPELAALAPLSLSRLSEDFRLAGRLSQQPPEGDWRFWSAGAVPARRGQGPNGCRRWCGPQAQERICASRWWPKALPMAAR